MNEIAEYIFVGITIIGTLIGAMIDDGRGLEVDWKANTIIGLILAILFTLPFVWSVDISS